MNMAFILSGVCVIVVISCFCGMGYLDVFVDGRLGLRRGEKSELAEMTEESEESEKTE